MLTSSISVSGTLRGGNLTTQFTDHGQKKRMVPCLADFLCCLNLDQESLSVLAVSGRSEAYNRLLVPEMDDTVSLLATGNMILLCLHIFPPSNERRKELKCIPKKM
jgi:hypothetical protein